MFINCFAHQFDFKSVLSIMINERKEIDFTMVRTLKDIDISDKRVIMRVDYNVSIIDGQIANTKKIDDTFETIDYLVEKNAKIILLSHFGRVSKEEDKENNSLRPVYDYIKSLNRYDILFSAVNMGEMLTNISNNLKPRQIVLAENTRFLDIDGGLESNCDIQLSMYWASIADVYIDDAFGSMHRKHSSIAGIPKFLPSAIGFLVEKEISNLDKIVKNPDKPFVVVMGGAKLEDKIELMYSLAEKADFILLGGGIANTFLKALGYDIGSSFASNRCLNIAKQIMKEFPDKIVLPKDVIINTTYSSDVFQLKKIDDIAADDVIGDIGSGAIQNYKRIIDKAGTIFVNGTVGMYERYGFANGTSEILNIVSSTSAFKVVGGGDAISALKKFKLTEKVDFVSTGGGATLQYIADGELPGIIAIEKSQKE